MIYVVTLMTQFKNKVSEINKNIDKSGVLWFPDEKWTAGYFLNLQDAISAVTSNDGDVFEHHYKYAVIEECEEGFYKAVTLTKWYRCEYAESSAIVEEIESPVYNKIIGYAF